LPPPEHRLTRALLGISCCVLLGTAWLAQPATARVKPTFYGLNFAFYDRLAHGDRARLAQTRLRTMRVTINWSDVEPNAPPVPDDWSQTDALFTQLAKLGIRAQPLLYSSPYWVNGLTLPNGQPLQGQKHSTPPVGSAEARADWRAFVQAAVNRYKPGGTFWTGPFAQSNPGVKPLPIRLWQVWNEPNIERSFTPRPSVRKYASVLKIAHGAILAADPTARVALAGMPTDAKFPEADYLKQLYGIRGIKKNFDVLGVHPYGPSVHNVRADTARVRKVMRKAGDGKTPIWVSETSWGSAPKDGHINQGPKGQARMLTRTMRMFAHRRRALNINEVSWFGLRDPGPKVNTGDCTWCRYSGLLDPGGNPKPAWKAFRKLVGRR
jgi:polysaccharide biosynthesis protein PslG